MSHVHANGISLHVQEVSPAGEQTGTVVLIHGMASDSMASWFLTLAHPLAQAGLRVLLYDLRGHGRSERPATGYGLDTFVADLDALLDHWDVTGPVQLFGNSFGGTVAFAYAAYHPDRVAGLVAIESAPPTATWFARLKKRLGQARNGGFSAAGRGPLFARKLRDTSALLNDTSLAAELPASRLPAPELISGISCPVLCLYGAESAVHELAPETEALLPQTETVIFPGARHTLLIDESDQVRSHVLRWLDRIPAR
ncbi:alpha/beta fold hydrolase [Actinoplanes friuliensis]|uniref:Alpha/beta hydrolase n=1 Tax=Actinoplanes friuliensis DSM 7358 TaxID=1246995 RepID=U5WAP0_9ACTN|nr:alpha/beta hydrolase [Actinoplanes friuliensis]AGZ46204.1 alpha/beta hydrolase [Actinoplanes friuliensis DSM 7358]